MYNTLFNLPILKQLSTSLSVRQCHELPILVIEHPKVRAALSLQGAQLIAWQPIENQPILWLSEKTFFKKRVAIRGGIPICWPWFGNISTPSHGFARIMPWKLDGYIETNNGIQLTLMLSDNKETQEYWPHSFKLIATFTIGIECEIKLESQGEYQATAALHSYLSVSDISQVEISGLGNGYLDKIDQGKFKAHQDPLIVTSHVDRIYTAAETSIVRDPVNQQMIILEHHDHSDVVVWNPGYEVARNMQDIIATSYKNMLCVETARISHPLEAKINHSAHFGVKLYSLPLY